MPRPPHSLLGKNPIRCKAVRFTERRGREGRKVIRRNEGSLSKQEKSKERGEPAAKRVSRFLPGWDPSSMGAERAKDLGGNSDYKREGGKTT